MNIYVISYKGSWLGGTAVVLAKSARQAIELVEQDPSTIDFTEVEITGYDDIITPKVLYNNNGEY